MNPDLHPQGGARTIERSPQNHDHFTYHHTFEFPQSLEGFLWGHRNCSPNRCRVKWHLLEIYYDRGCGFPIPANDAGLILDGTRKPRRGTTGLLVSYARPQDPTAPVAVAG